MREQVSLLQYIAGLYGARNLTSMKKSILENQWSPADHQELSNMLWGLPIHFGGSSDQYTISAMPIK